MSDTSSGTSPLSLPTTEHRCSCCKSGHPGSRRPRESGSHPDDPARHCARGHRRGFNTLRALAQIRGETGSLETAPSATQSPRCSHSGIAPGLTAVFSLYVGRFRRSREKRRRNEGRPRRGGSRSAGDRLASRVSWSGVDAPGTPVARAQDTAIRGLVTDTTGLMLPGVTVEARNATVGGQMQTTVTDGAGRLTISALQPGTYDVTFTLPGFAPVVRDSVEIGAGATVPLDIEMAVQLEERVVVVGSRAQPRSVTESTVPIDAISSEDVGSAMASQRLTRIGGSVATSGRRLQDGRSLTTTGPDPPSCPATIRSNGVSSNQDSSSCVFGGTCGMP